MKTINLLICVSAGLFLFGCAEDHTGNASTQSLEADASLDGTEWVLTGYNDTPLPEELRNRSELKFSLDADGRAFKVSGRSFINSYFGNATIDQEANMMSIPVVGATKMGGSQEDMKAEMLYFQRLEQVTSYKIDRNNRLILYFGHQGESAYFTEK